MPAFRPPQFAQAAESKHSFTDGRTETGKQSTAVRAVGGRGASNGERLHAHALRVLRTSRAPRRPGTYSMSLSPVTGSARQTACKLWGPAAAPRHSTTRAPTRRPHAIRSFIPIRSAAPAAAAAARRCRASRSLHGAGGGVRAPSGLAPCSWQIAAGSWPLAAGSWPLAAGRWQPLNNWEPPALLEGGLELRHVVGGLVLNLLSDGRGGSGGLWICMVRGGVGKGLGSGMTQICVGALFFTSSATELVAAAA